MKTIASHNSDTGSIEIRSTHDPDHVLYRTTDERFIGSRGIHLFHAIVECVHEAERISYRFGIDVARVEMGRAMDRLWRGK